MTLEQRTHPSGVEENLEYQNGYLHKVKAGTTVVYDIDGMNSFGQITAAKYGTNLNCAHNFDGYGFLHAPARFHRVDNQLIINS